MQAQPITVLHIDDDHEDREMVREIIATKRPDIIVVEMKSGDKALSFLEASKISGFLPSLIILDINLPGLDGKGVLLKIKNDVRLQKIPLVLLTTSSSELDKHFAGKHGVRLLTKPSSYEKMSSVVDQILSYCQASK